MDREMKVSIFSGQIVRTRVPEIWAKAQNFLPNSPAKYASSKLQSQLPISLQRPYRPKIYFRAINDSLVCVPGKYF